MRLGYMIKGLIKVVSVSGHVDHHWKAAIPLEIVGVVLSTVALRQLLKPKSAEPCIVQENNDTEFSIART